jgi:hypothetical protein
MVYLIRNVRVTGDWEKMESAARDLMKHWAKQAQAKSVEVWGNIAGRQDAYRVVVKFESLADEEKFSLGLMNDKEYWNVMSRFVEVFTLEDDELVRTMD